MNALWSYFWPAFGAGLLIGVIAGCFAYRLRPRRHGWRAPVALGIAAALAAASLWHGPIGAADRFAERIDRTARAVIVRYEMTGVEAHIHHGPLTREVLLSGPADDFQRSELVRYMEQVPGVNSASWTGPTVGIPLIAEGLATALVGYCAGLLLAFLVALRRRHNAQWRW